jgi:hypothetical protein
VQVQALGPGQPLVPVLGLALVPESAAGEQVPGQAQGLVLRPAQGLALEPVPELALVLEPAEEERVQGPVQGLALEPVPAAGEQVPGQVLGPPLVPGQKLTEPGHTECHRPYRTSHLVLEAICNFCNNQNHPKRLTITAFHT